MYMSPFNRFEIRPALQVIVQSLKTVLFEVGL